MKFHHFRCVGVFVLVCLLTTVAQGQATWYVDDDAPNDPGPGDPTVSDDLEDGTADHPFDAIQEGIDAAVDGDEVLVADGTYTGTGNRDIDFSDGLSAGQSRAITVRSENGPTYCTIDCEGNGRGFYFHSDETSDSVVTGFTIRGGYVDSSSPGGDNGGGIYCRDSSPLISNCLLTNNTTLNGGGIYCRDSSPTIKNCMITNNTASAGGGGYCRSGRPLIIGCAIASNIASYRGGGIYCIGSLTITNCTIVKNTADDVGGGMYIASRSQTLNNCILRGNLPRELDIHSSYPSPVITYTNIEGGWEGEGNIDVDPGFAFGGDFHLMPGSPCIDAGTNDPLGGLPFVDFDGNLRPLDGDGDQSAVVDMGAYEFNPDAPSIALSAATITFASSEGAPSPEDQVLEVRNCGGGALNWDVVEDCAWLVADPPSGSSAGQIGEVTLRVDATGLVHGAYECVLTVSGPGAVNGPRNVHVVLYIHSVLHVPAEYGTIQEAIDASIPNDVVLVADGIYTGLGNKDLDFGGKKITVRSENGAENCIINCENNGRGFYFHTGETSDSVVEGFTIQNGYADSSSPSGSKGGGIYCSSSTPTIMDCTITDNTAAGYGGGMYNSFCSPTVTNCTIAKNAADYGGGIYCYRSRSMFTGCTIEKNTAPSGAGLYCTSYTSPTLTDCTTASNIASSDGGGIYCSSWGSPTIIGGTIANNSADNNGGGIYCRESSYPTITNCAVEGNTAGEGGGGIYCDESSTPKITNCAIEDNIAGEHGGGIYCDRNGNPTLTNCIMAYNTAINGGAMYMYGNNSAITNCVFKGNTAYDDSDTPHAEGGAMYIYRCNAYGNPTITNCTFHGNSAKNEIAGTDSYGGGLYLYESNPAISNCIIWGNVATVGPQVYTFDSPEIPLNISYSDVESDSRIFYWGAGNIDTNPQFIDSSNGDFRLLSDSPCIDSGANYAPGGLPPVDLDGKLRPFDGDGDSLAVADMGAFEFNDVSFSVIAASSPSAVFSASGGGLVPADQVLSIHNAGGGTLNWEISNECSWLSAFPSSGQSTGEANEVLLSVDAGGLSDGEHTGTLILSAPDAANGPLTVVVTLYVNMGVLNVPTEYATIQSAIDVAGSGDIVLIADGTYTGNGNRDIDFLGKAIMVRSVNGPDNCIIDCQGTETDKHRGFWFHNSETETSVVNGLTIQNGVHSNGGGICCDEDCNPTITRCLFKSNSATSGPYGGGYGGGVYCWSGMTITDCTFTGNVAFGDGGGGGGGGVASMGVGGITTVTNCTFVGNTAWVGGGIMYDGNGTITGCTIVGNAAPQGSGNGSMGGGVALTGCPDITIANTTIAGNIATPRGGGVFGWVSKPTFRNCTITENRVYSASGEGLVAGGGVYFVHCSEVTLADCILWDNMALSGPSGYMTNSTPTVQYSDVEGGQASFYVDGGTLIWGDGNLEVDPLFVYPSTGGFRLSPGSPCIDAGDPASDFGLEPEPDGGRVNMGAFGNTLEATSKAGLSITGYGLVSRTRIGRTVFAYELTMTVHNSSDSAISDVVLTLLDMPDNVTIGSEPGEDTVEVGSIAAGATVTSTDTFKIIVDRTVPVSSLAISWSVAYTLCGKSGEFIFTAPLSRDDLDGESDPGDDGEPDPGDDNKLDVDERFEEMGRPTLGVGMEESAGLRGKPTTRRTTRAAGGTRATPPVRR